MKNKKKIISTLIKLFLVGGLFYLLAERGFLSLDATKRALMQYQYIIPSFFLMLTCTILSIYRWHILLQAQGIGMPFSRVFSLGFIGNFFNIALPGAVSGDVVKAFYASKEKKGNGAKTLGSILFDRVVGVSALLIVAVVAMALSLNSPWHTNVFRSIQLIVTLAGVGVVSFFIYLFLIKDNYDPFLILLKKSEARFKFINKITRTYESLRVYHHHKGTVLIAMIISCLIHCMVIYVSINFSAAFGETQIPSLGLFVIVPLGMIITAIPVMPAGIGTGHAAFTYLFLLFGSQRGADVYTLFALYKIFEGAMGGLVFLRYKGSDASIDLTQEITEEAVLSTD